MKRAATTQPIHKRLILPLALLGGLSILSVAATIGVLSAKDSGASAINIAGRQRMLSQRMTKSALSLERDGAAREELKAALASDVKLFESSLLGLQYGDGDLNIPNPDEALASKLEQVAQIWSEYKAATSDLLDPNRTEVERDTAMATLMEMNMPLLKASNEAVQLLEARGQTVSGRLALALYAVMGVALACIFGVWRWMGNSVVGPLASVAGDLGVSCGRLQSAAGSVATRSQAVASSATQQAASLEETAASLEEMSGVTRNNAANAARANELAHDAESSAESGNAYVDGLEVAMSEISASSDEMAKIVKNIEGIAFQTNLLALNAAVEAARAGEHGKGFAVVAEEVRNLAQSAAESARSTSALIEESNERVERGRRISSQVGESLSAITRSSHQVANLIGEIAAAGSEISQGIDQINSAVTQMDQVTQSNASSAEEGASVASSLMSESDSIRVLTADLLELVGRSDKTPAESARPPRRGGVRRTNDGGELPSLVQSSGGRNTGSTEGLSLTTNHEPPQNSISFDEF
jgi:methyl-accepting chemotaxis protein